MATWPVGLRFEPTEDELVDHHLRGKLKGKLEAFCLIPELYIYKCEPPDLFIRYNELSDIPSDGRQCFFFCPREDKLPKNRRSNNRMTEFGFWKGTCKERPIRSLDTGKHIGIRKILGYYEGRQPKGRKTDIVMHEYHLNSDVSDSKLSGPMAFVLCHIIDRKRKKARSARVSTLASSSNVSTPNDSGNGQVHEISAQASEEVMIGTEYQNEMSFTSMLDSNVPIVPQQAQMHNEQSSLYNDYLFDDGCADKFYAMSYSPSSFTTGSTPNDSGTGRAHKISAQASEEVTIETENQNEMSIPSMPDSNVPIVPQQAQMHEEQSAPYNDYLFIDGPSDECYAMPYSPSDGIEILDLWNVD